MKEAKKSNITININTLIGKLEIFGVPTPEDFKRIEKQVEETLIKAVQEAEIPQN